METIVMPWEQENLGVSSVEFRFDGSEEVGKIGKDVYDNREYDYQICRLPANCMDLMYFLQDKGFRYSETAFELTADLRKNELPDIYKKYLEMFDYHEADMEDLSRVDKVIRGGVFDTDRVALDPYFSQDKSGRRFANWCRKELESGHSKCYIVEAENSPIGFFVLKEKSNAVSDSFLAALYSLRDSGVGFTVLYYPLVQAQKEGKKKITTRVSSNNINSLKMHLEIGYKIKKMNYLLIKHIK